VQSFETSDNRQLFEVLLYELSHALSISGGQGTVGSHWEGRTYNMEVMTGTTLGHSLISQVTLTALEDTERHSCNMNVPEALLWGDWRTIKGKTIAGFSSFSIGLPTLSWPSYYVATTAEAASHAECTFDDRATACDWN
jgi:hypothetical protein